MYLYRGWTRIRTTLSPHKTQLCRLYAELSTLAGEQESEKRFFLFDCDGSVNKDTNVHAYTCTRTHTHPCSSTAVRFVCRLSFAPLSKQSNYTSPCIAHTHTHKRTIHEKTRPANKYKGEEFVYACVQGMNKQTRETKRKSNNKECRAHKP